LAYRSKPYACYAQKSILNIGLILKRAFKSRPDLTLVVFKPKKYVQQVASENRCIIILQNLLQNSSFDCLFFDLEEQWL